MSTQPNPSFDQDDAEVLVSPADIRSTSRSCFIILMILLVIVLLLCVFGVYAWTR